MLYSEDEYIRPGYKCQKSLEKELAGSNLLMVRSFIHTPKSVKLFWHDL